MRSGPFTDARSRIRQAPAAALRIGVFGLGYVGSVTAASLADQGHRVTGVDINPVKLRLIQDGKAPVLEPGLGEIIQRNVNAGRLRVSEDAEDVLARTDLSIVCVGTPSNKNGSTDLTALERTVITIGRALSSRTDRHTLVVRSTAPPGTCRNTVVPLLESSSGRHAGTDIGVVVNPEFLREGSSVADFHLPAKTVIGELDAASGDLLAQLYAEFPGPLFRVSLEVAEMIKYADNAFHALKITFANEIGAACHELGIDSHEVMDILCADTKLNISAAYLRPGFAFGGSCLPKDLRALLHLTRHADLRVPVLESILLSNEEHLKRLLELVIELDRRRVGMFGLAFKPGTDDLRESPLVALSEQLLGKGFDLRIYDPAVSLSRLVGSNREYIAERIPHLSSLLVDTPDELLDHAEVCIIGSDRTDRLQTIVEQNHRVIVDLIRLPDAPRRRGQEEYIGIAW
jgi:GDP-mannose 6-dehydrogenase